MLLDLNRPVLPSVTCSPPNRIGEETTRLKRRWNIEGGSDCPVPRRGGPTTGVACSPGSSAFIRPVTSAGRRRASPAVILTALFCTQHLVASCPALRADDAKSTIAVLVSLRRNILPARRSSVTHKAFDSPAFVCHPSGPRLTPQDVSARIKWTRSRRIADLGRQRGRDGVPLRCPGRDNVARSSSSLPREPEIQRVTGAIFLYERGSSLARRSGPLNTPL